MKINFILKISHQRNCCKLAIRLVVEFFKKYWFSKEIWRFFGCIYRGPFIKFCQEHFGFYCRYMPCDHKPVSVSLTSAKLLKRSKILKYSWKCPVLVLGVSRMHFFYVGSWKFHFAVLYVWSRKCIYLHRVGLKNAIWLY